MFETRLNHLYMYHANMKLYNWMDLYSSSKYNWIYLGISLTGWILSVSDCKRENQCRWSRVIHFCLKAFKWSCYPKTLKEFFLHMIWKNDFGSAAVIPNSFLDFPCHPMFFFFFFTNKYWMEPFNSLLWRQRSFSFWHHIT